nr:uncharacterized protein LOC109769607 [Aegilops tauschii subsp. strangulata]
MTTDGNAAADAAAADAAASSPAPPSPLSPPVTSSLPTTNIPPAPLPLQTVPPPNFYPTPAYMHAMRVENAHINLPVRLAMNGANYTTWRGMMLDVIDQYDVASWIAPDFTDHAGDASWNIVNKAVNRWFLGAMVTELAAFMLDREATAAQTWASVEALFVNNRRARRFQLQTELTDTRQGDSSISIFCARLKSISDALRDAGKTLDDDELVIQLLRGVNKDRHQTTAKIIEKSPTPVPFDVAVGMLLHDEIGNNFAGSTHHSALAVQQKGPSPAPPAGASGGPARPPTPGFGGGKPSSPSPNQGHNKRRRYTANGGYQGAAPAPPWTGHVYAYPMALPPQPRPAPGILGPRPPHAYAAFSGHLQQPSPMGFSPTQQYLPAPPHHQQFLPAPPLPQQYQAPQYIHPPTGAASNTVDHSALMSALHNLSLQSPSGGWVADSGASSHLAADPGLSDQGGASSMQQ